MTRIEIESHLDLLDKKYKIRGGIEFNRNWFKFDEATGKVTMCVTKLSQDGTVTLQVPSFVQTLEFKDNTSNNIKNLYVNAKSLEKVDGFNTRVKVLQLSGCKSILQELLQQIYVVDKLIIGGDIEYIGSFAFLALPGCQIDIRNANQAKFDTNFLKVLTPRRRTRANQFYKNFRDTKIYCTNKQYERFINDKNFRYKTNLVQSQSE